MRRLPDGCVPSFALALFLVGCASNAAVVALDTTTGGQAPTGPDPGELVAEAAELVRAGQCVRAVAEALAIFEHRHGRDERPPLASRVDTGSGHLGPEWSDAMYLQAFCLVDMERNEEAVELLERALALIPNDVVYACELGHIRQLEGAFEEAMGIYQRALDNVEMLRRAEGLAGALLFGPIRADIPKTSASIDKRSIGPPIHAFGPPIPERSGRLSPRHPLQRPGRLSPRHPLHLTISLRHPLRLTRAGVK